MRIGLTFDLLTSIAIKRGQILIKDYLLTKLTDSWDKACLSYPLHKVWETNILNDRTGKKQ